jgi:hypothetical protein
MINKNFRMNRNYKHLIQTITLLLLTVGMVNAQPAEEHTGFRPVFATGAEDRTYWVKLLMKIADPIVNNLAEGTLKKNMPLETGPEYTFIAKDVSYVEAVGRTAAGLAPWLALPDDNTAEGKLRKKYRSQMLLGFKNAVDPKSPDCLNFADHLQPIVDAAYIVHAFLRAPKALWEPLDSVTKRRYVEAFTSLRNRASFYNNWLLFSGLTEAFLLKIGESHDPFRLAMAIQKLKEWYVGDGWYSDGPKFSMDYYNSYVIHPMMVDLLKIAVDKKVAGQSDLANAQKRMQRYAVFLERLISPEGNYPAFGRSITYRTGAFQSLAQSALEQRLPEILQPAQIRCALTKVMQKMFDGTQNFDKNGWLVLGFNGHQPEIADFYTSTGSLYMATLAFLPLGLPADNAFWTGKAEAWTSVKAWEGNSFPKDYHVEY